jgi:hypothetical protein
MQGQPGAGRSRGWDQQDAGAGRRKACKRAVRRLCDSRPRRCCMPNAGAQLLYVIAAGCYVRGAEGFSALRAAAHGGCRTHARHRLLVVQLGAGAHATPAMVDDRRPCGSTGQAGRDEAVADCSFGRRGRCGAPEGRLSSDGRANEPAPWTALSDRAGGGACRPPPRTANEFVAAWLASAAGPLRAWKLRSVAATGRTRW